MLLKTVIIFFLTIVSLWSNIIDKEDLNGTWHLRVMDGMEVRKARAILDFDMDKMKLSGFDGCNRIGAKLICDSKTNTKIVMLRATRMACRNKVKTWVSRRLHEALKEGYYVTEERKYGVKGMTLKSSSHELFFKRMQRN